MCMWPKGMTPLAHGSEVHVWCAEVDASDAVLHRLEPSLSADERRRADAFRFDRDRRRFVMRRAVLRNLLGQYLGANPNRIALEYGSNGKPALGAPFAERRLHFNLSHSADLAVFAFARDRAVGVDVELMGPLVDLEAIADRYFSPVEKAAMRSVSPSQRLEAFFNAWTRKEAYVKARGEGLARSFDSFDVSLVPGEPARLLNDADSDVNDRWSLRNLAPAPGFLGAVAAAGEGWDLRCWHWQARS